MNTGSMESGSFSFISASRSSCAMTLTLTLLHVIDARITLLILSQASCVHCFVDAYVYVWRMICTLAYCMYCLVQSFYVYWGRLNWLTRVYWRCYGYVCASDVLAVTNALHLVATFRSCDGWCMKVCCSLLFFYCEWQVVGAGFVLYM